MAAPVSIARPGIAAGRYIKSLIVARGDPMAAHAYGMGQGWGDTPATLTALKSAVAPSDTTDATSAGPLVAYPISADFVEFLRPQTLVGRLIGATRVPFHTRMLAVGAGGSAAWVGEAAAIPATKLDLDSNTTLGHAKVQALSVITNELARSSSPSAEAVIAADVARAISYELDKAFADPTNSGSAGVRPPSVFNNATEHASTGSTVDAITSDLQAAIGSLTDADEDLSSAVWIMSPRSAAHIAGLRGTGGSPAFPQATARGGSIWGIPILTSRAVPDLGSPEEGFVGLLQADGLALADDGAAALEFSEHAAVQMLDNPTDSATQMVSLWQNGLAAIKATRYINWQLRRAGAAAFVSGCKY